MNLWDSKPANGCDGNKTGVRSCENPKSRFRTARPIPSENEGKIANFAPYGTAVFLNLTPSIIPDTIGMSSFFNPSE